MRSRPITSTQLRDRYQAFFAERGHARLPSASLVPANDPTVLFTTAGMHPLVPYLLGEHHPSGRRLVSAQKCVRTGDIDAVGDDTHLTFFEMLGNWSLGDYGREQAIAWCFEFLTEPRWLGLPLERLGVTCFAGDDRVPGDEESVRLWRGLGVPDARIQRLGRADNWWGPAGNTGPCGPDTEIFYWTGDAPPPRTLRVSDPGWVEIWNNVFMGYALEPGGALAPLPRMNVDTGMGLERTLVALNGLRSVFEVDTLRPLLEALRALAVQRDPQRLRVLTDHLRASCLLVADGVVPSNKDRGYVLRRLLRRAAVFAQLCGLRPGWPETGVAIVEELFKGVYPLASSEVTPVILDELRKFERTVTFGLREIEKREAIDGALAFDLLQTHGFPFELTRELAREAGKPVDEAGFREQLEGHRLLSRQASAGTFRGGLADHSEEIVRYHTLTHLLQAALRLELGDHVIQRGSNLTRERLRFDFSHPAKLSSEQLRRTEARVNEWIRGELAIERGTMTEPQARALGAIGAFGERYTDVVVVHTVRARQSGEVISREFCGGPHVRDSGELRGTFKIVREQAVSAGVRRIRAVFVPAE